MALDLPSAVSQSMSSRDIWQGNMEDLRDELEDDEFKTAGATVFTWLDEYLMIGADGSGSTGIRSRTSVQLRVNCRSDVSERNFRHDAR
jgi:hypothetical protein